MTQPSETIKAADVHDLEIKPIAVTETETRHMASFAISPTLLEQVLEIPAGHEIVGAKWDFASRTVRLFLEGPDLPEIERGQLVPSICPIVRYYIDDEGKRHHVWDWNNSGSNK